ncbi:isocitrate lyase/PEP mutase family protein [Streptomyces iconiensis]|uniref:Isocitrate lyase/phosphoenolpyruvate mutase family protein n=1 Tax=Streptomyces iconiensis TaxID=1384038 RepID=A0ABT6ZRZ5_9ACTN|nr:isocitrate lyase/phosphoenolpyruvate mutase family protein [Streptomyces iconiensis]MDJ1131842.1 isocitrate lyase/phosphoenolpyruvate mutase family protein [Streptomyces iconiensis]
MNPLATPFAALHRAQNAPLVLPNAWDHGSATALYARGFAAIGTSSLGVAAAAGLPDGAAETRELTVGLAWALGRGGKAPFLLSVDAEGGFSDDPSEVAALATELAAAGAVGINLEDGRTDGTLTSADAHAAKIAAVKEACPDLFVNARTDTHWLGTEVNRTVQRLLTYEQAGADGAFAPALTDTTGVRALTETLTVPLNLLYSPALPDLRALAALGVRRLSLGSLPYRQALTAAADTAAAVRDGHDVPVPSFTYAQVQGFIRTGSVRA